MKYGESTFDILYLLFAIISGCLILRKAADKTEKYMGLAALILGCLVTIGLLQPEVHAEEVNGLPNAGKSAPFLLLPEVHAEEVNPVEFVIREAVDVMLSGSQKMIPEAMNKVKAAKEAAEQAGSYDFTLGFAGDICLADNYIPMQHLKEIGSEEISDGIDPCYIEIMQGMDLMWINNEFVYSLRGEPLPTKAWTFCGDPANVKYLKDLGVDIVGLANNHTFDFGEVSFLDTLETLEDAQIPYVGAGRTLEQAQAPVYLETNGIRIAYVAASRAEYTIYTPEATETEPGILWCYDNTRFLESIRTAAANADYVIALPHWGMEHTTMLEEAQISGAYAYIDAGADAVIGAHPHILQGIEYYKGKPILYSLGNFWFDGYDIDTLVAQLHIKGKKEKADSSLENAEIELRLYPGTQSGAYTALADTEEWKSRILDYLESISVNITIDEDGVVRPDSP